MAGADWRVGEVDFILRCSRLPYNAPGLNWRESSIEIGRKEEGAIGLDNLTKKKKKDRSQNTLPRAPADC